MQPVRVRRRPRMLKYRVRRRPRMLKIVLLVLSTFNELLTILYEQYYLCYINSLR